jgi:DNA-directed RNA polymerase subunit RPC12/RpoP
VEDTQATGYEVECPHCHRSFSAQLIEGSAERYRGFKCPHCKLFVPAEHGEPVTAPPS